LPFPTLELLNASRRPAVPGLRVLRISVVDSGLRRTSRPRFIKVCHDFRWRGPVKILDQNRMKVHDSAVTIGVEIGILVILRVLEI
jgi:hypothetical protein